MVLEVEGSVGPVEANKVFRDAEANHEKEHFEIIQIVEHHSQSEGEEL